jgi:hypothetical protein
VKEEVTERGKRWIDRESECGGERSFIRESEREREV